MPVLKLNDANIYYEVHGEGQPVILIAGYSVDHLVWLPVLDKFGKYFKVIMLDNRGSGKTTDSAQILSAELLAADVLTLIDELKLERPHIFGHSMGGTIAQTIATTAPDKIGKLVLLNTTAKWRKAALDNLYSLLKMREANVNFDLIFPANISTVFGDAFLSDKEAVVKLKELTLSNPNPQTLADQARQFNILLNYDGRSDLNIIQAKTAVVMGVEDFLSLPFESEYLAKNIPHANLFTFNCGHVPMIELTHEFAAQMIKFLQEN